eukprot:3890351-Lingulodinium_polyedra.AAC.1
MSCAHKHLQRPAAEPAAAQHLMDAPIDQPIPLGGKPGTQPVAVDRSTDGLHHGPELRLVQQQPLA